MLLKYEKSKKSNSTVFEIAKNINLEIQYIGHRLATKKLAMLQVPRNISKTTLICSKNTKNRKKNLARPLLRLPKIFIHGIQLKAYRTATKKNGLLPSTA